MPIARPPTPPSQPKASTKRSRRAKRKHRHRCCQSKDVHCLLDFDAPTGKFVWDRPIDGITKEPVEENSTEEQKETALVSNTKDICAPSRRRRNSVRALFGISSNNIDFVHDDGSLQQEQREETMDCASELDSLSSSNYATLPYEPPIHDSRLSALLKACPPKGTLEFIMENGLPRHCDIQTGMLHHWVKFP